MRVLANATVRTAATTKCYFYVVLSVPGKLLVSYMLTGGPRILPVI